MSGRHVCAACGKEIVGKSVGVGGEHFHPECFVCGRCKNPITGKFQKQDGERICTNCTPATYCEACKAAISGTMFKLDGKAYHRECFTCADCSASLEGGCCSVKGRNLCSACASAGGTVKVHNTCKQCKKRLVTEEDSVNGVGGDWFCVPCFVCGTCGCQLEEFVMDKDLRSAGKYAYLCRSCSVAGPGDKSPGPLCVVCGEPCGPDDIHLYDGSSLHRSCFKCSLCAGVQDARIPLIRDKVRQLKRGSYTCGACQQVIDAELGTYGGRGKAGGADVTYCVCLKPQHIFWLDFNSMTPIATSSWHAEGRYTREAKAEGSSMTLTVECCPFGGGPAAGTVYLVDVEAGGAALVCEGIRCARSNVLDAGIESAQLGPRAPSPTPAATTAGPAAGEAAAAADDSGVAPIGRLGGTAAAGSAAPAVEPARPAAELDPQPAESLSLEKLRDPDVCGSLGVDPATKEMRLSDADFAKAFGVQREEFMKLPKWKRDKQKKELGLF